MMKLTPSKALKEIGLLKENGCYIKSTVEYKIVETALIEYEKLDYCAKSKNLSIDDVDKKLKALEIIKEKEVNVEFWFSFNVGVMTYKSYTKLNKKLVITTMSKDLTEEEFDLLKEVLK